MVLKHTVLKHTVLKHTVLKNTVLKNVAMWASITLGLIACGSAGPLQSNPGQPDSGQPGPVTPPTLTAADVRGRLVVNENQWPQGRTGTLRAVIAQVGATSGFEYLLIGKGRIDGSGRLEVKLVTEPTPTFLRPFEICGIRATNGANWVAQVDFTVAQAGAEDDPARIAAFVAHESPSVRPSRVYLDRNLEIDATCSDPGAVRANLSLKKGWNLILETFTQPGSTGSVYTSVGVSGASGVEDVPFVVKRFGSTW
jgi:hypothetical protein